MTAHGLYVHIPYCETKCGYCDFYSVPLMDRPTGALVSSIIAELRHRVTSDRTIRTVFVGGGTPTVLHIDDFRRFFSAMAEVLRGSRLEEFTVEANPATLDAEKMAVMVDAGVDRISMGAQSWHAEELATLERLHSANDIAPSVEIARSAGIDRMNLDLIFGIPGQSEATWGASLRRTMELGVDHIACYGLTYEPGTRLTAMHQAGRLTACDEDLELAMYRQAIATLGQAGYEQYEISNFAQPGQQSVHNLIYWRQEPYIGVGPSAAGLVDGLRYKNVADIGLYQKRVAERGDASLDSERVTGADRAAEYLLTGLRLNAGVDLDQVSTLCDVNVPGVLHDTIEELEQLALVITGGGTLRLSTSGRELGDSVISKLYLRLVGEAERAVSLRVIQ